MRPEVQGLALLGPLPSEDADEDTIASFQQILAQISAPVSREEACVLADLFGPDDCFGLAWVLLHLIETVPNWQVEDCPGIGANEWTQRLRVRAANLKRMEKTPQRPAD
jgi:hypothetical protein